MRGFVFKTPGVESVHPANGSAPYPIGGIYGTLAALRVVAVVDPAGDGPLSQGCRAAVEPDQTCIYSEWLVQRVPAPSDPGGTIVVEPTLISLEFDAAELPGYRFNIQRGREAVVPITEYTIVEQYLSGRPSFAPGTASEAFRRPTTVSLTMWRRDDAGEAIDGGSVSFDLPRAEDLPSLDWG